MKSIMALKRLTRRYLRHRRKGDGQQANDRIALISGLVVVGLSTGLSALGAWELLEQQSYNLLHQTDRLVTGAPDWDDKIAVIAIDDKSIRRYGQPPLPRLSHALLMTKLANAQPAAVAFDLLMSEATDQDALMAEAISDTANVALSVSADNEGRYLDVSPSIAQPAKGAFLRGDMSKIVDADGVVRRLGLQGIAKTPTLGLATLQVYNEVLNTTHQGQRLVSGQLNAPLLAILPPLPIFQNPENKTASPLPANAEGEISVADLVPVDRPVWIRWPGAVSPTYQPETDSADGQTQSSNEPSGELNVYSYVDVMEGNVDLSIFQNKIVLVGPTLGGQDELRTPFHRSTPTHGVFLHAAIIDNLLNRTYLLSLPVWVTQLMLAALTAGAYGVLRRLQAHKRLGAVVGFPIVWLLLAYGGFVAGWWLPIAAPIGTVLMSALAIQLLDQQERQQLMALFSMNVSPGTAELIWRHKGEILDQGELAAQNLTATVLFMDIRGFTSIAEQLPSQQLLPWLNQYFETMTDCIMSNGGMVDKYIGDAIMAVFGAPVPRVSPEEIQRDAIAGLTAAIEMHDRLALLNRELSQQGLPEIRFGIGIHTGPLVAGTVGNRHRLNYSLFGDTVNVAARLENMTKSLHSSAPFSVLMSAQTRELTQDYFQLQRLHSTQLRGRRSQTEVYTLIGRIPDIAQDAVPTFNVSNMRVRYEPAPRYSPALPLPIVRDAS